MIAVARSDRSSLRNHRNFIRLALQDYITKIGEALNVQPWRTWVLKPAPPTHIKGPYVAKTKGTLKMQLRIRILESVNSTRIRIPTEILPQEFIEMALKENQNKKYRFEFHQNRAHYVQIILEGKPLISEGQGILLYFFRELLQYAENKK